MFIINAKNYSSVPKSLLGTRVNWAYLLSTRKFSPVISLLRSMHHNWANPQDLNLIELLMPISENPNEPTQNKAALLMAKIYTNQTIMKMR